MKCKMGNVSVGNMKLTWVNAGLPLIEISLY